MCGIIGVVRRRSERTCLSSAELFVHLENAQQLAERLADGPKLAVALNDISAELKVVDTALSGVPGVIALLDDAGLSPAIANSIEQIEAAIADLDRRLDIDAGVIVSEDVNAALILARDLTWAISRDRLRTAREVQALAGSSRALSAIETFTSVQMALSALDRLEVRGRDSAGLHLMVRDHGLDANAPTIAALIAQRNTDSTFGTGSVRVTPDGFSFVYKAAAEIGELGDNTAEIRAGIASDELLAAALDNDTAETVVLGHTRWASVGIVSQANAHPLNSDQTEGPACPYVTAALNGDVDNFADLKASDRLKIDPAITTDAKVIPTMVANRIADGADSLEAFRASVSQFEGSVAIGASVAADRNELLLALRGSGQALYVGLMEDGYIVASEPYGVVEETDTYLRIDGETPADPDNPVASQGQIVSINGSSGGAIDGIVRRSYDGRDLPVSQEELVVAEVTTRDIDRGDHPHYLLKEIGESPTSFRKTLRGRLHEVDDVPVVDLAASIPAEVFDQVSAGKIREVLVIGQGTAAVAGQSLAHILTNLVSSRDIQAQAMLATELSGFGLRDDMTDTLVVALSQSGTTTDTNTTVDLARSRGAKVLAIVNRRGSDLTDKADGVIYTSDGRDVEMSVASTKAFYSQIAAGVLVACAIADHVSSADSGRAERAELLRSLRSLPSAMETVIESRPKIAEAARRATPSRRYWAIVGNGANRIAAEEIRIKLSELCYKSIASDSTEDKKHIDLSCEPMILVCAAGLEGSTADDVAKEVAIYAAHKAAPVVVANEGERRFDAANDVLSVPVIHPGLAFVLSTVVGHLYGYEAALAIDAQAEPLREIRAMIDEAVAQRTSGEVLMAQLRNGGRVQSQKFFEGLQSGEYNGHLEASTASRLATSLRYATAMIPLESYQLDRGKVGTPAVVIEDLAQALNAAVEELTRPIDAIKHQAKTVTVGISRADETLLQVPLARAVLDAGAPRDGLSYRTLRTLSALDPTIAEVVGFTRYRIEGDPTGQARLVVVDRSGLSLDLVSRTDTDPTLRGTKHQVAIRRELLMTLGRRDGRSILIVPSVKDGVTTELTLLHVALADQLDPATLRGALQGYAGRYAALVDAVTETEPSFDDERLPEVPVAELLTAPIPALADYWRT